MAHTVEFVRQNLDGSMISTYVLVMLIVPLKIACRVTNGNGMSNLGWDDAFAVVSLIIANGFFYSTLFGRPLVLLYNSQLEVANWKL